MILKFNEIVFTEKYELRVKKHGEEKALDVPVSLTDEEAKSLGEMIKEGGHDEDICKLLFTDQWDDIQELLVGPNLTGFVQRVLKDFGNFTLKLIREVVSTES